MTLNILPNAKTLFVDANGVPLAGGSVYFYIPNTTTFKTTWQDSAGTIPNSNPVILDSNGEGLIWGSGAYRQVVKDSLGNLIWDAITIDPGAAVAASLTGTSTTSVTIGTGTKSFTTQPGLAFFAGGYLIISSNANAANYMVGTVTSYNPTTGALVMNITFVGGSGNHSDWNISITGLPSTVVGTVTSVSIATANGFSGSSSGGSTPALTIVAGDIVPNSVNGLTLAAQTTGFTIAGGITPKTFTYTGATGTGNVVYSASPTLTGTLTGVNAIFTGTMAIGTSSIVGAFQSGVTGTYGTIRQVINGTSSWFGIYNSFTNLFYGIGVQLPAPSGTSTIAGYFNGLGIGGSSAVTATPIFGVLSSTQSGSGIGNTAFTITDSNVITTFNSTLDNGAGLATFNGVTANGLALTSNFTATFDGINGVNAYRATFPAMASTNANNNWVAFQTVLGNISGTSILNNIIGLITSPFTLSNSASAGNIGGVQINAVTCSGTSSFGVYNGVQISMPIITSTSSSFGGFNGINITGASVTGSAAPGNNIAGINIGSPTLTGTASGVNNSFGINISNQGGGAAATSYGIFIASQAGSANNSYAIFCSNGFSVNGNKNVTIGTAALATTATAGFLWIPSCAGVPTGNATAPYTQATGLVYDTTDNRLYATPNGGATWKQVALT